MLPRGLLKEYSRLLSWVLRLLDMSAIGLAGVFAYGAKFSTFVLEKDYAYLLCLAVMITPLVFRFSQIYDSVRSKNYFSYFLILIQGVAVLFLVLASGLFISKTADNFSRLWFLIWIGFALASLIIVRGSLFLCLRQMRARGWNERRVVVIGSQVASLKIVDKIKAAIWTGFRVVTVVQDEPVLDTTHPLVQKMPADLAQLIKDQNADEVWLAYPLGFEHRVKLVLHELRYETVTTRLFLNIEEMDVVNYSIAELAGFPVINIRTTPMIGINRLVKALEDRVVSLAIIALISPILLIIAAAIKLTSTGPIFYKQKRVSWNGVEFHMLKFRTMPVDAEAKSGPVWATQNENRATRVGAFLRKTSLDELPQFFNVLKGDMSIVGPRPERLVFVDEFKQQIPGYMQKHLVKAGITGWAQINGWRGNTSLEKRIEFDLYYIENWSLTFDFKIIFLTLLQGFIHKNAY
jgi:putative colanic acid biosynthesis UDP-glucose lipid carrier transferase